MKIACSSGVKFGLSPVATSSRSTFTVGHDDVDVLVLGLVERAIEVAQVARVAHRDDLAAAAGRPTAPRLELGRVADVELLEVLHGAPSRWRRCSDSPEDREEDDRERDAPLGGHLLGHEVDERRREQHEEDEREADGQLAPPRPAGSAAPATRAAGGP